MFPTYVDTVQQTSGHGSMSLSSDILIEVSRFPTRLRGSISDIQGQQKKSRIDI